MEITLSTVTFADWKEIIEKAKKQAKGGNPVARKFLADYLIGPPPQKYEHSGPGGGAIELKWPDGGIAEAP